MIDLHAHLTEAYFQDREGVLERAREGGVEVVVLVGYDGTSSEEVAAFSRSRPGLFATCGIHPNESKGACPQDLHLIAELCREEKVIAVGEVGLDFYRDHSPRAVQKDVFLQQMELARALGKPLMIHCREAFPELLELLHNPPPFVAHCFSGDKEIARELLNRGGYLSFAGSLTYPKNHALREAAHFCPLDRLFVETDSPYLPPQPVRGRRNEPAFILHTAAHLCELRKISLDVLKEALSRNFYALFPFAKPAPHKTEP